MWVWRNRRIPPSKFIPSCQEFTKVEQCEGEPWPVGRISHAACCLGYGGDHAQLLVTGGIGEDNKTLKDAWLFDLSSGKWREVREQKT